MRGHRRYKVVGKAAFEFVPHSDSCDHLANRPRLEFSVHESRREEDRPWMSKHAEGIDKARDIHQCAVRECCTVPRHPRAITKNGGAVRSLNSSALTTSTRLRAPECTVPKTLLTKWQSTIAFTLSTTAGGRSSKRI